jgi:ribosomal protein S27AE
MKVCARCGYSAWRDNYPCTRCGALMAAEIDVRTAPFYIDARFGQVPVVLICTCSSTPPTMPTFRDDHLPGCPLEFTNSR